MSLNKRYFDMLGAAYDVPSEAGQFDAFLEAAMTYFFAGSDSGDLAEDVPRHDGDDDMLETHAERISALVEAASRREAAFAERFHAVLDISVRTGQVSGNAAASQLTGRHFPCALDDVPLDPAALSEIRRVMRAATFQAQDRIILANIETGPSRACLALIQRPKDSGDLLHVSLSYIDWSPALMTRLGEAFGLTSSETEILEAYLGNLSQKDIASQRGRSLETVKGQSKSILRKTGCARMSDVVQLSASIAYLMRQLPERETPPSAELWQTPRRSLSTLSRPGGRELAWYRMGTGSRPVLFIHGYLQGPFLTQAMLARLAAFTSLRHRGRALAIQARASRARILTGQSLRTPSHSWTISASSGSACAFTRAAPPMVSGSPGRLAIASANCLSLAGGCRLMKASISRTWTGRRGLRPWRHATPHRS